MSDRRDLPILFSTSLVPRVLSGEKTQTRRLIRMPKMRGEWEATTIGGDGARFADGRPAPLMVAIANKTTGKVIASPRQKGDFLWVREAFGDGSKFYPHQPVIYRADFDEDFGGTCREQAKTDAALKREHRVAEGCRCGFRWRPSIHMPRKLSRITLEVLSVRAERVQEISEEDAKAEGAVLNFTVKGCPPGKCVPLFRVPSPYARKDRMTPEHAYRWEFAALWDDINGKRASWSSNPLVWRIEFKRIEQEQSKAVAGV